MKDINDNFSIINIAIDSINKNKDENKYIFS